MGLYKVAYKGTSTNRIIGADHLKERYGIGVSGDLIWSPENFYMIYMRDIPEPLMEIFRREGTLTVTEIQEGSGEEIGEVVTGKVLDDTGFMVIDATTGQRSQKGESNPMADPVIFTSPAPTVEPEGDKKK